MDVLAVADIQADMITDAIIIEPVEAENVADPDVRTADRGAEFCLVPGRTRQFYGKKCFVDIGREAGAVKSDIW